MIVGPSEVTFFQGKTSQWMDYIQSPALAVAGSSRFCAVGMEDATVNVYSHTGRRYDFFCETSLREADITRLFRLMPTLVLSSPCAFLEGCKQYLLAITTSGLLHTWYGTSDYVT